ncbi:class I SAM-dependent methyltransferase [Leucobacter sp. OH1287]|uniref:class I SAM-dependent methyltransferase n=1 Tax=Leucobacter sp. OH1287 TaxID=2491049 RepID=UPI000F6000E6|nr:methyltransferase [Leucobacter sp. OH1287]RRD61781.1 methyltransferase domain-containing protein [Leucobacter sp. OH1287]
MSDHYFSASPSSPSESKRLSVTLGGQAAEVLVAGGVFSGSGVDRGTAVLLKHLPDPPATGDLLDIGCGWGTISLDAALRSRDLRVWGVDVNERALSLTRQNADLLGLNNVTACFADQVPTDLSFAEIRSNPPIRVGKKVLHELMLTWLPRLSVGGSAFLVVAKKLGAESFERWLAESFTDGFQVSRFARDKGFHVIRVLRTA